MLDLVITRQDEDNLVHNLEVCPSVISDHAIISFNIPCQKPTLQTKLTKIRRTKDIDVNAIGNDISQSELIQNPPEDLNELAQSYEDTLSDIFNKHAPVKEKEIVLRPHAPWYTDSIKQAKRERRQAERRWKKTKLTVDREILKDRQQSVNKMCDEAKTLFYNKKIEDAGNDSKELFKLSNTLLKKAKDNSLPTHTCEKELANNFGNYFSQKIEKIRTDFTPQNRYIITEDPSESTLPPEMRSFKEMTEDEIEKVITSGNSKSCTLDPLPTSLLKEVLPTLLPTIHTIVNRSLTENLMPAPLKNAIVKPLIKKSSLDKENMKNFRPVSNLSYIGKIIEKVAVKQIEDHLSSSNLHEPLQSAYTANHSTETALLKVSNDILCALDKRQCVYLVLLDLSAAFDTIDHTVFLARLREEYAVGGGVLDWMESYLINRHQHIIINSTQSDQIPLQYGFPQGSTIGPFGFKLYTKPLTSIARKHKIEIHLYADDTQLYVPFDPEDSESALSRLESCIEEIRLWMNSNFLKLNDSKTEFIIFGTPQDLSKVSGWTVTVGDTEVLPSTSVRNIGAFMDSSLNMKAHVNNFIRSCYCQIHSLSKIRKSDSRIIKKMTHAFVNFN